MKTILVIGAGRSSSSLIRYLLAQAPSKGWRVRVGDVSLETAQQKIEGHPSGEAFVFDIKDAAQREKEIAAATLVISMLPAFLHTAVAKDCVRLKKHLATASYVSPEMRALDEEAQRNGVILLNEIGLDPGIDHMSAMQIIHRLQNEGAAITGFRSYCGGLVAPESNDNPWGYKFSWNPRNVILAGQGTAQYIEDGRYKYLPYNRLFAMAETISVDGYGDFDAYANRDSLSYREPYGLEHIGTMIRGTLRMPGFCKAWNAFVQLGWTDDSYTIKEANTLRYIDLVEAFLPKGNGAVPQRLAAFLGEKEDSVIMDKLRWAGIFSEEHIPLTEATPAQILQDLLERKWVLGPHDKDLIVMQHIFDYTISGTAKRLYSSLVVKGDDQVHTAMAKTVGLPLAIGVKMILDGTFTQPGVHIPTTPDLYEPILAELEEYGIRFSEQ